MGIRCGRHRNIYNVENPPIRKELKIFSQLNGMIRSNWLTLKQIKRFIKKHHLTRELYFDVSRFENISYPPFVAVESREPEVLDMLCSFGFLLPDPHIPSTSHILPSVCKRGDITMVKKLVEDYGFDVNETDRSNVSLFRAVTNQHADVVKFLVAKGAWLNVNDSNHKSILHITGRFISPELYAFLISSGAEVNTTDHYGNTPLHYAADVRCDGLVYILLQSGAKVNMKNKAGLTPFAVSVQGLRDIWRLTPMNVEYMFKQLQNITISMLDAGYVVSGDDLDILDVPERAPVSIVLRHVRALISERSELRCLQELCIFKIRDLLSVNFLTAVERLPIANKLKDFIKLTHVASDWEPCMSNIPSLYDI